ncbi:MAG: ABC transporter ATP-binding protein [Chloroflexi bacterium]|nr:ABC transporter ATP-binding protein [Chloroflexota bacterium]
MSYIETKKLVLGYQNRTVIDSFDIDIPPGSIVGLIGPNGSGKTTILRALAGLLKPKSGEVHLDQKDLSEFSKQKRARLLGWVPQREAFAWSLSVEDIVTLGRAPHRGWLLPYSERDREVVNDALTRTELHPLAQRTVDKLSGGEFQRVLIARALAQEPKVLLLDEPTANLDIHHQIQVMDLVQELVKKEKMTAIIAIHDLNLAARYCERLILIDNGKARSKGSPQQVLSAENLAAVFNVEADLYRDPHGYWALGIKNGQNGASAHAHRLI